MKTLWIATVEHVQCPGTRVFLFHREVEPTNNVILARMRREGFKTKDLEVTGCFSLTHACEVDPLSQVALNSYMWKLK